MMYALFCYRNGGIAGGLGGFVVLFNVFVCEQVSMCICIQTCAGHIVCVVIMGELLHRVGSSCPPCWCQVSLVSVVVICTLGCFMSPSRTGITDVSYLLVLVLGLKSNLQIFMASTFTKPSHQPPNGSVKLLMTTVIQLWPRSDVQALESVPFFFFFSMLRTEP